MADARTHRLVRQALRVDRLLGADSVPIQPAKKVLAHPAVDPQPAPEPTRPPTDTQPATRLPRERFQLGDRASAKRSANAAPLIPDTPSPAGNLQLTRDQKAEALAALDQAEVKVCTKCPLCQSRRNTVFGEGDPNADLMFIGEGPGADEDGQGRPFVGKAGQLLDKQIAAMGLQREQVFIANIVKCRPPSNRVPTPEEAEACVPYLVQQIDTIGPKVIVGLGGTAVKYLMGDMKIAITRYRGQWRQFRGVDFMPTFHPAYLLRQYTPENRRRVWSDLQAVMEKLGLK